MKKVSYIILIWVISFLMYHSISMGKSPMQIQANQDNIKKDEQVEISVNLGNVSIAAFTLEIYFDTTKLEYTDSPENSNYSNNRILYTWVSPNGEGKRDLQIGPFIFKAIGQDGITNVIATGEFYSSNGEKVEIEDSSLEIQVGEIKKQVGEEQVESNNTVSSDNTNLKVLRLNHEGINPEFSKDIKEYYFIADNDIDSLEVTALPENNNANVLISGNENLKTGLNTIKIHVDSADKTKQTDYKIYVTKTNNREKANANLETLAVRQAQLTPEFDENVTQYTVEVPNNIETIELLAIPQKINANVNVSKPEELKVGDNKITITVLAEDGITKKKYEILVHRRNQEEEVQQQEEQKQQAQRLSAILEEKQQEDNNQQETVQQHKKTYTMYIVVIGIIVIAIVIRIIIVVIKKRK